MIVSEKEIMNRQPISKKDQEDSLTEVEMKSKNKFKLFFNQFSAKATKVTGSLHAFIFAVGIVVIWAATGPIFHYSDTWQLVINTGTTIVTFLMVFIIQHSQNKDTIALQLKLNELIAVSKASNKLISVENLPDEELQKYNEFYTEISKDALKCEPGKTISFDDAQINIDSDNVDIHITPENLNSLTKK